MISKEVRLKGEMEAGFDENIVRGLGKSYTGQPCRCKKCSVCLEYREYKKQAALTISSFRSKLGLDG